MLQGWSVIVVALGYIGLLFAIAHWGDKWAAARARASQDRLGPVRARPWIYAFSLGVYCTSWTFFGSVGLAGSRGLDFLTIYVGPIVMFTIGYPILRRVIRLAKAERSTSIADFMAARYGKSQMVAAVVTIIALVGIVPYIALQLKAVSVSVAAMVAHFDIGANIPRLQPVLADLSLLVALTMAAFACLFGTRQVDATEHQEGLMLAIAAESVVKLVAFLVVGVFVMFGVFDGPGDFFTRAMERPEVRAIFEKELQGGSWIVMTILSFFAILLLPRMFHVIVVENNSENELNRARWVLPGYLIAINLFVIPIAVGGLITFGDTVDADTFVLRLPLAAGYDWIGVLAFIGGLSAATAMVIVASVALAIMVCNELVVPLVLRGRAAQGREPIDMADTLLTIRRVAIFVILILAYIYYRAVAGTHALAEIGLLAFAAIAQFAPAFFGGLLWRKATARGAITGMTIGFAVWTYTLLVPAFVEAGLIGRAIVDQGPYGLWLLRPQALFSFGFDPLIHGVFWSLTFNVVSYVLVSLARAPEPIERLQANIFVPTELGPAPAFRLWRTAITVDDLRSTIERYLGEERTQRAFADYGQSRNLRLAPLDTADVHLLRFSEQLLASAIGAASSRLVLSLLVKRRDPTAKTAMRLLDDASAAIQYNRDLLQTALDQVRQGLAVFDPDMRLITWNRQFRDLLDLPPAIVQVGTTLDAIVRFQALRGEFGPGDPEKLATERIGRLVRRNETYTERMTTSGLVLDVRTSPMPDGGIVATFTDVTERVHAAEQLSRANETLERRVHERTEELTRLNQALASAKAEADEANAGKTRFLAAAGHDILQPLNAARLYVTSLVEKTEGTPYREVANHIDASLDGVEEIIGAVLDISRLDTGALKPEISVFRLDEVLKGLKVEFEPSAIEHGLSLTMVPSTLWVRSDRRLLRRLLQNLISNAIKYTPRGKILVGCRRRRGRVVIEVHDTGVGIPKTKLKDIFGEFQRLEEGARIARGLGLGLSIVERIGRVLGHAITVTSDPGRGSRFAVELPTAPAIPVKANEPSTTTTRGAQLDGLTVLVIDNDAAILDGMRTLLTGWRCVVLTASGGKEAAVALKARGAMPDAILADYHLDESNGIDVVIKLRWTFGIDMPAVLVTADRSLPVRDRATEKGIDVLHKPVKPAALRALLAQVRARRQAAE
jgi:Na+/proline symporter/signal transduction histidine kinase/CheY-like chemotaxis protein